MNHLAHFLLSGNDHNVIIGNFITDYIKKSEEVNYAPEIRVGIDLHREIDRFTDSHVEVREANAKMRQFQHKYTPVVMDVCFDHLLAQNWNRFSTIPLRRYVDRIYEILADRQEDLPPKLQRSIKGMIEGDWLASFEHKKGLAYTFSLLKRRLKFENRLEYAVDDLYTDYAYYNRCFVSFFRQLDQRSKEFLSDYPSK